MFFTRIINQCFVEKYHKFYFGRLSYTFRRNYFHQKLLNFTHFLFWQWGVHQWNIGFCYNRYYGVYPVEAIFKKGELQLLFLLTFIDSSAIVTNYCFLIFHPYTNLHSNHYGVDQGHCPEKAVVWGRGSGLALPDK